MAAKTKRKKREVSPPYPFFGLRKCAELVTKLYKTAGQSEVLKENALRYMELDPNKNETNRAYSAITNFGLIDERRSGAIKKVSVSELARKIILVKGDESPIKLAALQTAASNYDIIRQLRMTWPSGLEDDNSILNILMVEHKFSDRAANSFLPAFRETYEFAKLGGTDVVSRQEDSREKPDEGSETFRLIESVQDKPMYTDQAPAGLKEYPILLLGTTAFVKIPIPLSDRNRQLIMKWFDDNQEALTYSSELAESAQEEAHDE